MTPILFFLSLGSVDVFLQVTSSHPKVTYLIFLKLIFLNLLTWQGHFGIKIHLV